MRTTINRLNHALAACRGVDVGTLENYSRPLSAQGVFPKPRKRGAPAELDPTHAARYLFAVMRGSPRDAAKNAKEVGDLILHFNVPVMDPLKQAILPALGWPDDINLASAVGWLIQNASTGQISRYLDPQNFVSITVDRHWTQARISWVPTAQILQTWREGWMKSIPPLNGRSKLAQFDRREWERRAGHIEFVFESPVIYQINQTYALDANESERMWREYEVERTSRRKLDVGGSDVVHFMTVESLAKSFPETHFSISEVQAP